MKRLRAKDEFAVGKNGIAWVGPNFKEHLYDLDFSPSTFNLARRTLDRSMHDEEILAELKPQAVLLGDVLYALKYLEHDGWYLFYVNDRKGTLWAVSAYWCADDGGWDVSADSVGNPFRWNGGHQVLSRCFFNPLPSEKTLSHSGASTLELRVESMTQKDRVFIFLFFFGTWLLIILH